MESCLVWIGHWCQVGILRKYDAVIFDVTFWSSLLCQDHKEVWSACLVEFLSCRFFVYYTDNIDIYLPALKSSLYSLRTGHEYFEEDLASASSSFFFLFMSCRNFTHWNNSKLDSWATKFSALCLASVNDSSTATETFNAYSWRVCCCLDTADASCCSSCVVVPDNKSKISGCGEEVRCLGVGSKSTML